MQRSALAPRLHLFVCANRRAANDPLGPGCGDAGEATHAALKSEIAARGAYRAIWATKTYCLGLCPKRGCTVAAYASSVGTLFTEVEASDAAMLLGMIGTGSAT